MKITIKERPSFENYDFSATVKNISHFRDFIKKGNVCPEDMEIINRMCFHFFETDAVSFFEYPSRFADVRIRKINVASKTIDFISFLVVLSDFFSRRYPHKLKRILKIEEFFFYPRKEVDNIARYIEIYLSFVKPRHIKITDYYFPSVRFENIQCAELEKKENLSHYGLYIHRNSITVHLDYVDTAFPLLQKMFTAKLLKNNGKHSFRLKKEKDIPVLLSFSFPKRLELINESVNILAEKVRELERFYQKDKD